MQLSHMAPPRPPRPQRHPVSPRRDLPYPSGIAHNPLPSPNSPDSAPFREARKTKTPPGALRTDVGRFQPNTDAAQSARRVPAKTPHPFLQHQINELWDRNAPRRIGPGSHARSTPPTALAEHTPTHSPASSGDSTENSEGEVIGLSRPVSPPAWAPSRGPRGRPIFSRPPQQLGSFHSQYEPPNRRVPIPSSTTSRSIPSSDVTTDQSAEAEWQRLWTALSDQRLKIRTIRAYLSAKRQDGRMLREDKDRVDNDLMKTLRPQLASSGPTAVVSVEVLEEKFGDMQRARNEYYTAQFEYERIETDLMHEEARLQVIEDEVHRFLENERHAEQGYGGSSQSCRSGDSPISEEGTNSATVNSSANHTGSTYTLLGISEDLPSDMDPLYHQLLDAAGHRDLAKEHHEEIRLHHDRILHDLEMNLHRQRGRTGQGHVISKQDLGSLKSSLAHVPTDPVEFREKFGVGIDKDDLDFLRDYERDEQGVRRKLEQASREVERLTALCMEKGVMRKNAPLNEEYAIHGADSNWATSISKIDLDIQPRELPRDLSHPVFPILLSNPSHVLELHTPHSALQQAMQGPMDNPAVARRRADCVKEFSISNLMKNADNMPDYINQWLIHKLRTSPLEVELLYSIFESSLKIRNRRRWQEDVLYHWRLDDAAKLLPDGFGGTMTPRDAWEPDDSSINGVNSAALTSVRAKSEQAERVHQQPHHHDRKSSWCRSIKSLP